LVAAFGRAMPFGGFSKKFLFLTASTVRTDTFS
jgi:hypothetical protein